MGQFECHEYRSWKKISSYSSKLVPDVIYCDVSALPMISPLNKKLLNHCKVNNFAHTVLNTLINFRILIEYNSKLTNLFNASFQKCIQSFFDRMFLLFDINFSVVSSLMIHKNHMNFSYQDYANFLQNYQPNLSDKAIEAKINEENYLQFTETLIILVDNIKLLFYNLQLLNSTLDPSVKLLGGNEKIMNLNSELVSDTYCNIIIFFLVCKFFNCIFDSINIKSSILNYQWNLKDLPTSHLEYVDKIYSASCEFKRLFSTDATKSIENFNEIYNLFFSCFINQCSYVLVSCYANAPTFCNSEGCAQRLLDNMQLCKYLLDLFEGDVEESMIHDVIQTGHSYTDGYIKIYYLPQGELEASINKLKILYQPVYLEKMVNTLPQLSRKQKAKIIEKIYAKS